MLINKNEIAKKEAEVNHLGERVFLAVDRYIEEHNIEDPIVPISALFAAMNSVAIDCGVSYQNHKDYLNGMLEKNKVYFNSNRQND